MPLSLLLPGAAMLASAGFSPAAPIPHITLKPAIHFVGIESSESLSTMGTLFPRQMPRLGAYIANHKLTMVGAPFIQYKHIDMSAKLTVVLGMPVLKASSGDGTVESGTLPAGRYAALDYFGPYSGLEKANGTLIDWMKEKHFKAKMKMGKLGEEFVGRVESYETDPAKVHDPAKYETVVQILLSH